MVKEIYKIFAYGVGIFSYDSVHPNFLTYERQRKSANKPISTWLRVRAFIFIRRQDKRFLSIASRFARSSFAHEPFSHRQLLLGVRSWDYLQTEIYGNKDSQRSCGTKTFERNTRPTLFRLETVGDLDKTLEMVLAWYKKRKRKK